MLVTMREREEGPERQTQMCKMHSGLSMKLPDSVLAGRAPGEEGKKWVLESEVLSCLHYLLAV